MLTTSPSCPLRLKGSTVKRTELRRSLEETQASLLQLCSDLMGTLPLPRSLLCSKLELNSK